MSIQDQLYLLLLTLSPHRTHWSFMLLLHRGHALEPCRAQALTQKMMKTSLKARLGPQGNDENIRNRYFPSKGTIKTAFLRSPPLLPVGRNHV